MSPLVMRSLRSEIGPWLTTAAAALLGCGGGESAKMPEQEAAFRLVQAALGEALPGERLEEPDVRWWTEPCPGTDTSAVVLGPRCYSGLYYRHGAVDVAWRGTIGQSAYTHELMHYFLDTSGRGSDAAHAQTELWRLVERIDTQLQDAGM